MGQEKQWMEFEPVYYDEMTGLLNKRFINNIQNILSGNISLTFFDIDNFKFINDRFGHFAGDKVIQEIGMLLKSYAKKHDYPLRFGGDEFMMISKNTDLLKQQETIENYRKYVCSRPFIVSNKSIPVTLSFGLAEGDAGDIDAVMQNADFALYCSKEKGKNCTTLYTKREATGLYMPFREEREIKKALAGEKNVIIKGGFKSGKSTLLKKLKLEFPAVSFIELEDSKDFSIKGQSVVFYNPAAITDNKKANKFLFQFKQRDYEEYSISSFAKDDIVRFLELAGRKATLFTVNYLNAVTNGNPFLISRFLSKEGHSKFDTLSDYPADEEVSALSDSVISMLKKINPFGFEIHPSKIASDGALYNCVMHLIKLAILEEKNDGYTYMYPPLFFHFAQDWNNMDSYKKMFEIARKKRICQTSKDSDLITSAGTDLYNYGDMEESMEILNIAPGESDEYHSLKARIFISQSQFEMADLEIEQIKDKIVKSQMNVLKTVASAGELDMEKMSDPYTNILYMSYCIRKQSFEMVEEIEHNIDQTVLTQKEYVSFLSNLANYYMFKQRENEAADYFLKCEDICKKQLFLADLGKVYMQMGNMFDQKGQLFKALEYFNRAMDIFPYTNMSSIIWSLNLNLAVTYLKLGEFSKALDMFTSLLSMEREKTNEFYRMIIYNDIADGYIRMFEWENAEYYNNLVLDFYKSRSSVPDFAVFQNRKIALAKNSGKWLKLDYFNKDDIISILDSMVLDFVKKNRFCSAGEIKDFTGELLRVNKNEEILYKAELLCFMCYIYRDNEAIKKHLLKTASMIFLSLNMNLRENLLRKFMEEQ